MDCLVVFPPDSVVAFSGIRSHSSNQFSMRRDGTPSPSRVLAVTSVRSKASACAAINRWFGPMGGALPREVATEFCVAAIGRERRRQDLQRRQQQVDPFAKLLRFLFLGAVAKLGGHDDAGADRILADLGNPAGHRSSWPSNATRF